jgi:hypothetical protein
LSKPFETQLGQQARALSRAADTADAREGITASGEKRKRPFLGR